MDSTGASTAQSGHATDLKEVRVGIYLSEQKEYSLMAFIIATAMTLFMASLPFCNAHVIYSSPPARSQSLRYYQYSRPRLLFTRVVKQLNESVENENGKGSSSFCRALTARLGSSRGGRLREGNLGGGEGGHRSRQSGDSMGCLPPIMVHWCPTRLVHQRRC